MKIKIKNNPKGKSKNRVFEQAVHKYVLELLGSKAFELGTIEVNFRKFKASRYGVCKVALKPKGIKCSAKATTYDYELDNNYRIFINKYLSMKEMLITLAHECVHIKQYKLGELKFKAEIKNGRRQTINVWKNKEYKRKKYGKRGWEVEARSKEKKLFKSFKKYYGDLYK